MTLDAALPMSKRDLLALIGRTGGAAAMYFAMSNLGQAHASPFKGVPVLDGGAKGASVLILGAGVAGLTAAYELRRAGYQVQVLEYNDKVGGRSWTLRGGDTYTELGGAVQNCGFAEGNYINPGPWRIPHNHYAIMHYCHELGVALEPFMQLNYNAYIHSSKAFDGKPQRFRHIQADFMGHVSELLVKAVKKDALADTVTKEDGEILLEALREIGALDKDFRYVTGPASSVRRGWAKGPGGGLTAEPIASEPMTFESVLRSGMWSHITDSMDTTHHTAIFQPVGGMDMIPRAFAKKVGDVVRLNSKVTAIKQDEKGVTASYVDTKTGEKLTAQADWCICTIPLSILSQIEMNVGADMAAAIGAVPYAASLKVGLEFKRRFWEQDEQIYGGITMTDLPIGQISYPSSKYGSAGPASLLGAYGFGAFAFEFTSLPPAERVARTVEWGSRIHPQYKEEFLNGIAVGWHRVPWTQGCFGQWTDEMRAEHYKNLCQIDGRIMLAGEHASYIPAWQEGGILSALDTIGRLHQRVMAG
ncbi:NAD(P)/FAD-dependent oxidoreductase [Novosphingobium sp.]|uniref:NAD(P)/FAD-dependent oxidoreductase n=1 Tax=Novosphingobium sp. TaxID=1874826 RepID=UPI002632C79A|nr:flavin monoamine oxidase family protein [Novosphingobium sp.]